MTTCSWTPATLMAPLAVVRVSHSGGLRPQWRVAAPVKSQLGTNQQRWTRIPILTLILDPTRRQGRGHIALASTGPAHCRFSQ